MQDAKSSRPTVSGVPVPTLSRTVSSAQLAIGSSGSSSNLATLKALISTHKALLANVRRGNEVLENDNARMARALAGLSRRDAVQSSADGGEAAPIAHDSGSDDRLRWVENYLQDTLAQTLWALDVRATRLEQEVAAADRPQAKRVLEMTRAAYDQIRSLLADLRGADG